MRTSLTRRLAPPLLLTLVVCGAGSASAHEADWIYFPMYERDTAHAVHLSALRFRPDGLLEAASRYPRHDAVAWTEEQSKAGWYDYAKRLIDCETGFSIETEAQLLDRGGKPVASRPHELDQWIAELGGRLQNPTHRRWPDNSEIALACISASHPTLKADRARRAATPVPLITNTPTTQTLIAETTTIAAIARRYFDLDAIRAADPRSAEQVFDLLQTQYLGWRRSIDAAYVEPVMPDAQLESLRSRLEQALKNIDVPPNTVRLLSAHAVESLGPWQPVDEATQDLAPEATRRGTTLRIDCRTGLAVTVANGWYGDDGRLLHSESIPAATALQELSDRFPDADAIEPPDLLQRGPAATEACQFIAQLQTAPEAETGARGLESITPDQLRAAGTPAAMLLLIRGVL